MLGGGLVIEGIERVEGDRQYTSPETRENRGCGRVVRSATAGAADHMTLKNPLLELFDRAVATRPNAPMLVRGRASATVADIDALARRVGMLLREGTTASGEAGSGALQARESDGRATVSAHAPPPGALVALAAPSGTGFIAALLALWRAGHPVLLLDPATPPAGKASTARAIGARWLLECREAWVDAARAGAGDASAFDLLALDEDRTSSGYVVADDIAIVKLTSGSTGSPRGVACSARSLAADEAALASSMGLRSEERIVGAVPMSHSYGLSSIVLPALMRGARIVLPEAGGGPLAPWTAAQEAGATFLPTAPAFLQGLVRLSRPPDFPATLRLVISAGAQLTPAAAAFFRETFGRPVHVFYGASECGGICYDREGTAAERGSVGTPVDGVQVGIEPVEDAGTDAGGDAGIPAMGGPPERGSAGIVSVRSPAVARTYLPHSDLRLAEGKFLTSDTGAWRDGELFLEGRLDDLINVKGKKVDPCEIERLLAELPGVEESVVVGIPAGPWSDSQGGGEAVVRAVIACEPGRVTRDQIVAHCRSRLPEHKVPRSIVLVRALPRTDRGKVSRKALIALGGDST